MKRLAKGAALYRVEKRGIGMRVRSILRSLNCFSGTTSTERTSSPTYRGPEQGTAQNHAQNETPDRRASYHQNSRKRFSLTLPPLPSIAPIDLSTTEGSGARSPLPISNVRSTRLPYDESKMSAEELEPYKRHLFLADGVITKEQISRDDSGLEEKETYEKRKYGKKPCNPLSGNTFRVSSMTSHNFNILIARLLEKMDLEDKREITISMDMAAWLDGTDCAIRVKKTEIFLKALPEIFEKRPNLKVRLGIYPFEELSQEMNAKIVELIESRKVARLSILTHRLQNPSGQVLAPFISLQKKGLSHLVTIKNRSVENYLKYYDEGERAAGPPMEQ